MHPATSGADFTARNVRFSPEGASFEIVRRDDGYAVSDLGSTNGTLVNGEPDPIELLRAGDAAAVRDLIAAAQRVHTPA